MDATIQVQCLVVRWQLWHAEGASSELSSKVGAAWHPSSRDWNLQIEKDLHRTFPGHPVMDGTGRSALRRILAAYARRNPSVGYCQVRHCLAPMTSRLSLPQLQATAVLFRQYLHCDPVLPVVDSVTLLKRCCVCQVVCDRSQMCVWHQASQQVPAPVCLPWSSIKLSLCWHVQGMNFIAGCLLLFMDEEDTFWCLAIIVEELLPGYYSMAMVEPQVQPLHHPLPSKACHSAASEQVIDKGHLPHLAGRAISPCEQIIDSQNFMPVVKDDHFAGVDKVLP